MSIRAMRQALAIFAITVLIAVIAAVMLYRYAIHYPDRPLGESGGKVAVEIPKGANFPKVVQILEEGGLLGSPAAFRVYVNYKGKASKIRAGSYTFAATVTPRELLDTLVEGVPAPQVTVTIPEGKSMLEVATLLAEAKVAPYDELLAQMVDRRFLRRLGVPGKTMEGYLFPDTYKLRAHTPPQEVLKKLFSRHKAVYYSLVKKHPGGLKRLRDKLRWGHHEIVTLASIVEKETGQAAERPRIAGVFLNRLLSPRFTSRLLQTDPTIIYGCTVPRRKSAACEKFKGRIRRIHLTDADNPYNTYKHAGLPPGPIANPGRAALEAVLSPERSRYFFFVSRNDGTHKFSATEAEHERAVDIYQRGKGAPRSGGD